MKNTVPVIFQTKNPGLSMKGGMLIAATPALLSHSVHVGGKKVSASSEWTKCRGQSNKQSSGKGGDFESLSENRISRQIIMEESKFRSGLYGISQGAGVRYYP
jgi:TldD protein